MQLELSLQFPYKIHKHFLPKSIINFWIKSAIKHIPNFNKNLMINIRFVDNDEAHTLNKNYRHKDYATNVLTFAYDEIAEYINADIVLCCHVVEKEALNEKKAILAHYAHLIIHGLLHACSYEHDTDKSNEIMQGLEAKIMLYLGFKSPYL